MHTELSAISLEALPETGDVRPHLHGPGGTLPGV